MWQMGPGGRWSGGDGVRVGAGSPEALVPSPACLCQSLRRRCVVLDRTGSGVASEHTDELSHDAEQQCHGKRCVRGCDSSCLKLDSFSQPKRTGQWVVTIFLHIQGKVEIENYLVALCSFRCFFAALMVLLCECFGYILHTPGPYTLTLKEKLFLFPLFANG